MTTWQQALKRIEAERAQPTLAEQLEREFTRISEERGLTRDDWIMLAAAFASRLETAQAMQQSLPDLAAGLMTLGSSKSAKVGAKASASKNAERRKAIGAWLIARYNRESFAKRGAKTTALHGAREAFGEPLDEKTMRVIAKEMRLTD